MIAPPEVVWEDDSQMSVTLHSEAWSCGNFLRSESLFSWVDVCARPFAWRWPVSALISETAYAPEKKPLCCFGDEVSAFFCRLPSPQVTTPTKRPHTLSTRRGPFRHFFCRVPNRRQPTCSRKNFTAVKWVHVWVERSRSVRVRWSQGRTETAMLCGSLTLAVFSVLFFPTSYWTPWCSTWVTILPFEIKMASFIVESFPLWVEWSRSEQEERSDKV